MLGRHDPASIERALDKTPSPPPPFPPASDRTAWDAVREGVGEKRVSELLARAEADARAKIPSLPATLYLEFSRDGSREGYEGPANRRREMLSNLALAECLEGEGRFLDPLLDVVWAICEESSWSWPAHQGDLADMDHPVIDLSVAMTARPNTSRDRPTCGALSSRFRNRSGTVLFVYASNRKEYRLAASGV